MEEMDIVLSVSLLARIPKMFCYICDAIYFMCSVVEIIDWVFGQLA